MKIDLWKTNREKAEVTPCGLKVLKSDQERHTDKIMMYCVNIWLPKATNPFVDCWVRTSEHRDRIIENAVKNYEYAQDAKEKRKAERRGNPAQWELVQVGFIFHFSWGYDQTNNNFYQVIDKKGQYVTVREIGQESTSVEGYSSMSDFRRPVKDAFLEGSKPMRKKLQFSGSNPYITMASYGFCDLWDGKEAYNSWYA